MESHLEEKLRMQEALVVDRKSGKSSVARNRLRLRSEICVLHAATRRKK